MPLRSRIRATARKASDAAPPQALAADLRARVGPYAEVITNEARCDLYTRDRSGWAGSPAKRRDARPALVLKPGSIEDIAAAVEWAHAHRVPIVPRGLSTTAHGESVPAFGGLLLDLAQFNRIGPLDPDARTVQVEAGATWGDLDAYLERSGLALATYPASRFSTVGGWVATGGLGVNSFGFGHLRRWVAALEVVTGAGERRSLNPRDKLFEAFFGAEGAVGVVAGVTLRLRPAPTFSLAHLFYFASTADQIAFVQWLIETETQVAHVQLYDPRFMAYQNRLYAESNPDRAPLYDALPAALVHVDSEAQEESLEDVLARAEMLAREGPRYAAAALWRQRFYPLALKRYGPSLLTAPVAVPVASAAAFLDRAMRLGERFGLAPAATAVVAENGGQHEVFVTPLFPCDARRRTHRFHTLLAHLVTAEAIRRGGRPYAVGDVNRLFAEKKLGPGRWRIMQAHRRVVDPIGAVNPRPAPGWGAALQRLALRVARVFAAQIGQFARMLHGARTPPPAPPRPRSSPLSDAELHATINACTGCGSCVPVCPAYLVTHEEATTGRAKLQTGLRVLQGETVSEVRAEATFLCTYCGACQNVCEAELPLLAAYMTIEAQLAAQHGRPDARIADFVARVESSAAYKRFAGVPPIPARTGQGGAQEPPDAAATDGGAPARRAPVGPFHVARSEHCINCGHCAHVCPAEVHSRRADDVRLMAQPVSHQCVGCMRCVEECPTRALTVSPSTAYAAMGQGVYTAEVVQRLARLAETGGQGPAAHEAGAPDLRVTLGRRLERVAIDADGALKPAYRPPAVELAAPIIMTLPRMAGAPAAPTETLTGAIAEAARRLGLLALLDWDGTPPAPAVALRVAAGQRDALLQAAGSFADARLLVVERLEGEAAGLRTRCPALALAAEAPLDPAAADTAVKLAHVGADAIILNGSDGLQAGHPTDIARYLPEAHEALAAISRRERVSLVVRGGIAAAEDMVQAIMLGADAVIVDWPLLIALECRLQEGCVEGAHVCGVDAIDADWATRRLVNLLAAWMDHLRQALGALGVDDVERLRGARGRAAAEAAVRAGALGGLRHVTDPSVTLAHVLGR